MLHGIAALWGSLLFLIPNRAKDTTLKNLRACFPNLEDDEIMRLAKASLSNTACTAMEMGKAWLLPLHKANSLITETEGLEELRATAAGGKGIILLAPHLSNWEAFGQYICQGIKSTFMYQPPKLPALDRLLRRVRSRGGAEMAPTNKKGVALLLKALNKGELVGVLPDQVPNPEGGQLVEFFGEPALTMTLVSKLIARSDVKVFCGFAKRLPKGKGFRLIVREADQEIYSDDLTTSVRGLNKTVEECVLMAMEQYQWEYKRFKSRPGIKKLY
jgi:KDO2-lipid IV(A) lauroyltransferase